MEKQRLRELEMGGLVDYSPGGEDQEANATFIVIGSKGDHYVVKIGEPKRTCTCMDYRWVVS